MQIKKYLSRKYDFLYRKFPCNILVEITKHRAIINGYKIYKNLLKKYGDSVAISICPYKGTGDVYLAAGLFSNSVLKHENNVFCVIGTSNEEVARLFFVQHIEVLSLQEMNSLFRFAVFTGIRRTGISILHPNPPKDHTGIIDFFRNINDINFADIIRYSTLEFKDVGTPVFPDCNQDMESLFYHLNLKKGKTVLLAPYSYTLDNFNGLFWRKLAESLLNMGYSVCTNIGSRNEKAIEGTKGISLKYGELYSFLKMAGIFIGIRSGLCEIVSSIPCKKIILYHPFIFWGTGDLVDYFSLNKMGICNDAVELKYKIDFYSLIEDIKNNLEEL